MSDEEMITPVASRHVDPEHVETELMELWNDVTDQIGADTVLRARSLTLVAFTDRSELQPELQETLAAVSRRHPSRAVVIVERPNGSALDTWISVHCQRNDRTRLCNEQIMIETSRDRLDQVSSLVLALVVPDLPIAVWWWGDVVGTPIFDALYDLSDRFLLDASTFQQPIHSLAAEAADLLTDEGYPVVADLAWEESVDWRDLITKQFDVAEWAAHLPDLAAVDVSYDWTPDTPYNPAEALLVAGWMAHRLDWTPVAAVRTDGGGCLLTFDTGTQEVRLTVRRSAEPLGFRHGIAEMEMRTSADPPFEFHLSRERDGVCGTLTVTRADEILHRRTVSLETPDRVDSLDRFLTHVGRDRLFGATLRKLAPLLRELV